MSGPKEVGMARCDRCCARPIVAWALLESDLDERDLELCRHHSAEYAEGLVAAGWVLVEELEVAG